MLNATLLIGRNMALSRGLNTSVSYSLPVPAPSMVLARRFRGSQLSLPSPKEAGPTQPDE